METPMERWLCADLPLNNLRLEGFKRSCRVDHEMYSGYILTYKGQVMECLDDDHILNDLRDFGPDGEKMAEILDKLNCF